MRQRFTQIEMLVTREVNSYTGRAGPEAITRARTVSIHNHFLNPDVQGLRPEIHEALGCNAGTQGEWLWNPETLGIRVEDKVTGLPLSIEALKAGSRKSLYLTETCFPCGVDSGTATHCNCVVFHIRNIK
jgi:hypothetical protein